MSVGLDIISHIGRGALGYLGWSAARERLDTPDTVPPWTETVPSRSASASPKPSRTTSVLSPALIATGAIVGGLLFAAVEHHNKKGKRK